MSTNLVLVKELRVLWLAEVVTHVLLSFMQWSILHRGWVPPGLLEELLEHVEQLGTFLLLEPAFFVELVLLHEFLSSAILIEVASLLTV